LDKSPAKSIPAGEEKSKKTLAENELSRITGREVIGLNSFQNGQRSTAEANAKSEENMRK
jgi:hypothetical protein